MEIKDLYQVLIKETLDRQTLYKTLFESSVRLFSCVKKILYWLKLQKLVFRIKLGGALIVGSV